MNDDSKALTTGGGGRQVASPAQSETARMFESLMEMARDPSVDPAKIQALADLQMSMIDRNQREEFNRAKIKALMEMPRITKNGEIKGKNHVVQSRYSRWEDIDAVTRPILHANNLVLSFDVGSVGNLVTVTPILSHANGYVEKGGAMPLAVDTTGSKNATQGAGSAVSYGKRQTAKATLNIIEDGEDTDGKNNVVMIERADWQDDLLDDARRAALGGIHAYSEWFKAESSMRRGFLLDVGEHEKCKRIAMDVDGGVRTEEPE